MRVDKEEYRTFNGEEFYSCGVIFESREEAKKEAEWWERIVKRCCSSFPFKYRIVKVKGGYKLFTNNTVRNMANY